MTQGAEIIRAMCEAGYALIPLCSPSCACASPGKVPHQACWETALFDVDELVQWHEDGGNIGWRMGPQGDGTGPFLVALDVDDAAALSAFERENAALPTDTLAQSTPRPGRHYIWRWPDGIPPPPNAARKKAIPGVDIRSAGGQIAVSPSRHKNGGIYLFETNNEINYLPEEWAKRISLFYLKKEKENDLNEKKTKERKELLKEKGNSFNSNDSSLSSLAESVRAAPNGSQRDTLNAAAYTAGGLVAAGRLDREAAEAALIEAAEEWEDFDPRRPWDPALIAEIVEGGLDDGEAAPLAPRTTPLILPPRVMSSDAPTDDPWGALGKRRGLAASELASPIWVCEGLGIAVDSKAVMVAARAGEGKSPFAAALAVSVALGRPFLGLSVRQGPVVVLAAEGALSLQRRLVSLQGGEDAPIDFVEVSPSDVASAEWRDRMIHALDTVPPSLVIVDTYTAAAMGLGAEHGSPEYAALALWLGSECARRGACCLLTVHVAKSRKADERPSMHDVAGTFMLAGAASSIVILHRPSPDADPNRVEVSCGRSLGEPFAPFEARWLGRSMGADPVADPLRLERLGFQESPREAAPVDIRALSALALEKLVEHGEFRTQRIGNVTETATRAWAAAVRATGARFDDAAWTRARREIAAHVVVGTDAIGARDPVAATQWISEMRGFKGKV